MMRYLSMGLLLIALGTAETAQAASKDSREKAAKKACLIGDPGKGVAILADLYIQTDDPTYIFNQGRCFEQNNRYEEALGRFREYLRKADKATEEEQAIARKHVDDCLSLLGQKAEPTQRPPSEKAMTAPTPPPAPVPPLAPEPAPTPVERPIPTPEPEAAVAIQGGPADTGGGSGLRIAGLVTASVGGAALVAAVVLNLKANGMVDDLERHYNKSDDSSSKTYRTLGWTGYGVGAGCLATGAILYYFGWRTSSKVALAPALIAGIAGTVLAGRF
jgi:hypothetical protein